MMHPSAITAFTHLPKLPPTSALPCMQVALFANARAVVGYHGAGFANTMLSTHGACVVE